MRFSLVADDFTGANDLALQMIKYGIEVASIVDLKSLDKNKTQIISSESRNIIEDEAIMKCKTIYKELITKGYDKFYKKIDSTLRGNVKVEVEVLRELLPKASKIAVVVPFPDTGRIIKGGKHYVAGIELHKSIYSKDPIHPIKTSRVEEFFDGTLITLKQIRSGKLIDILDETEKLVIFEGETDKDLEIISNALVETGYDKHVVGSSAIMNKLLNRWGYTIAPIMFLVGSCNDINLNQVDEFLKQGTDLLEYYPLTGTLEGSLSGRDSVLVRSIRDKSEMNKTLDKMTAEEVRSEFLDKITPLIKEHNISKIVACGGDISIELMHKLGIDELEVEALIEPGIAFAKGQGYKLITKPGGFGSKNIYKKMYSFLKKCR